MHTYARKTVEAHMHIPAPRETVFPLLCPVREYEWIETWQCTMIHSSSGVAEEGCVFQTTLPPAGTIATHPEAAVDTWVVCRYCPPEKIAFVRTNGHRIILYTISVCDTKEGTGLVWSQQLTALTETGNAILEETTQEQFSALVRALELMLTQYCTTGQMLAKKEVERLLAHNAPAHHNQK